MTLAYSESFVRERARTQLGMMTDYAWSYDPKRFAFTAARYKFVAKMLAGREEVLEVGCGDAFFSRIVAQHVGRLTVCDKDAAFVEDVNARYSADWPLRCIWHDMVMAPLGVKKFDSIFALDVIEHIAPEDEGSFLKNLATTLEDHGVLVIGTPSLESQRLASPISRAEHCNCKSGEDLRATMLEYFHSVFMFGMQDETVHTGHLEMAHYLIAVCADPRTCFMPTTIGR